MRRFALVAASLALLVLPGAARADIPPMNSGGCAGKKAGASCLTDDGKRGACNPSKCPQKSMLPDGALGFVQADCLLCYPSADTTSGGSSSGGSSGSTGAGSSSGGSASSGGSTKSGCNAAGGSSGSAAVLAVALGAFAWSRRRRMKALALGAVLASAALGAMAACGDSSSGGGAPSSEAGLDAPLFGETGKPDAEQEPGPGDPCGDRSGLQQSAPWPLLGGCPKRAGFADFVGPRNATTKWSVPVDGATSPVVDASRVIWVGTSGGDIVGFSQGGVFQGGAHTGAAVKGAAAMNVAGAAILGSTDGFLYGVVRGIAPAPSDAGADGDADTDADAGALSANIVLKQQVAPIASSAVIAHDGTIYLTTDDHIVALAQDGTPKWATPNIGVGASSPALGQDEILYVASTDHNLYALGPTGDVKGAYDAHAPIPGAPVIGGDGTIYVGSADGVVHAVDPSLKGKWTYQAGGAVNGLATYAGTVYAASADKKLHAISTVTGKAKWTFETLGSVAPPLVDKEGLVYFGSTDAKLYVLTSGGLLYFAVNAKGPITTAPAISDDSTLYVTTDKALLAIGP